MNIAKHLSILFVLSMTSCLASPQDDTNTISYTLKVRGAGASDGRTISIAFGKLLKDGP